MASMTDAVKAQAETGLVGRREHAEISPQKRAVAPAE
ncbi:hypothetical protein ALQ08_103856 [Pseudomonas syringae pv. delphinii]|uniref:Uncharacterized protein n=2 Tax=Pseudomonas syringae group genomosp. 3 TaxID=251701 RepID=A0A0P9TTU3_9PSED|nr:hypothetical protein ALO72_103149 [Pseudomonas syringae pv. delphinii]RML39080.1 hypothetical protein ALQ95_102314 [Pseudomonas syringae pv. ribicola]RMP14512.1 hypothetical protein ALQ28_103659 [Pseudomonas syringae pv. delphinii]RMP19819.1 hypothetical protein ALQ27_103926 [Pseudomonas syringae pv. delphinii]RMQ17875.1 hypothetical protein ALQ08_103856 [Pseudomonas syringae pv. delphinii]